MRGHKRLFQHKFKTRVQPGRACKKLKADDSKAVNPQNIPEAVDSVINWAPANTLSKIIADYALEKPIEWKCCDDSRHISIIKSSTIHVNSTSIPWIRVMSTEPICSIKQNFSIKFESLMDGVVCVGFEDGSSYKNKNVNFPSSKKEVCSMHTYVFHVENVKVYQTIVEVSINYNKLTVSTFRFSFRVQKVFEIPESLLQNFYLTVYVGYVSEHVTVIQ